MTATLEKSQVSVRPGVRGFLAFCREIGVDLAPFQRSIAKAAFGAERELAVLVPRGNAKTTTAALLGLHHLLSVPGASVAFGAASRDQARLAFVILRHYAAHPAIAPLLTIRHDELRHEGGGLLRVLASDGPRAHGRTDSFMVLDELWAHRDAGLLEAFQTALVKNPAARLMVISTAASSLDSLLGRLRSRALAGAVTRRGARIDARAPGLRWLEWSLPEGRSLSDMRHVAQCNPAPWVGPAALREQRARVSELAFAQWHANRWGVSEASWLPPGAWTACRADYPLEAGERVWLGIDIGGTRAASALLAVTEDLRIASCEVFAGDEAVLEITAAVERLAERFDIAEAAFDPWRYRAEALRLEREHGLLMVEFPQSQARMTAASERLHSAIVEHRLQHPAHPDLDRHVAGAVARASGRGWRLEKSERSANIDAVVALAMAVERAEHREPAAQLVGWL